MHILLQFISLITKCTLILQSVYLITSCAPYYKMNPPCIPCYRFFPNITKCIPYYKVYPNTEECTPSTIKVYPLLQYASCYQIYPFYKISSFDTAWSHSINPVGRLLMNANHTPSTILTTFSTVESTHDKLVCCFTSIPQIFGESLSYSPWHTRTVRKSTRHSTSPTTGVCGRLSVLATIIKCPMHWASYPVYCSSVFSLKGMLPLRRTVSTFPCIFCVDIFILFTGTTG